MEGTIVVQHHQSYLQHPRYMLTGNDNQNFQTISYCTKYCNDTLRFISKLEQDEMLVIITHFVYYAISIFQLANGMKIALIYNFLCHWWWLSAFLSFPMLQLIRCLEKWLVLWHVTWQLSLKTICNMSQVWTLLSPKY